MSRARVRVLRVIARLNVGGPALHVATLAGLDPERYRTLVVHGSLGHGEADMSDLLLGSSADVTVINELGRALRPWHDAVALAKLLKLVAEFRPHIIHTHTAKGGVLGRVAGLLSRRSWGRERPRVLHTFHGHVFEGYFSKMPSRAVVLAERRLAALSDRIVTLSETLRNDLVERFRIAPPSKIEVVPLGLDLEPFRQTPRDGRFRESLGLSPDTCVVAVVGRLVPVKNHRLLLRTVRLIRDSGHRNIVFLVVGGGELQKSLERETAELGISEQVRFLGWRRDLPAIYSGTDVVVLTSNNEGTPVSLIEAMAAGLPVVATNVGGVSDVVVDRRTGILVPAGSAETLAAALIPLASNREKRRSQGEAGRARALERFTKEKLVTRMSTLYEHLLARTVKPTHVVEQ